MDIGFVRINKIGLGGGLDSPSNILSVLTYNKEEEVVKLLPKGYNIIQKYKQQNGSMQFDIEYKP